MTLPWKQEVTIGISTTFKSTSSQKFLFCKNCRSGPAKMIKSFLCSVRGIPAGAILLLLIIFAACGKAKPDSIPQEITLTGNTVPLELIKEKEYRFNVISRGSPIIGKTDDSNNVYVYFLQNRNGNCEVIKLNMDLEVKNRFEIVQGEGPGEARNPRIYGGDGSFFLVYDAAGYKYIKYDADFKVMEEYRLNTNMGVFMYCGGKYIKEHHLVLDGFSQYVNHYDTLIRIYAIQLPTDGNHRIKSFRCLYETPKRMYRKTDEKMILGRPVTFGYFFDFIYFLDKRTYRLMKLDLQWHALADRKIRYTPSSIPDSLRKEWVRKYHQHNTYEMSRFDFVDELWPANWITRVGKGIAVGRCQNYDADVKEPISADYFDKDLNYLGKITLPYFSHWNHPRHGQQTADVIFYSTESKLFMLDTRGDDQYWIVRFGINYAESNTN